VEERQLEREAYEQKLRILSEKLQRLRESGEVEEGRKLVCVQSHRNCPSFL